MFKKCQNGLFFCCVCICLAGCDDVKFLLRGNDGDSACFDNMLYSFKNNNNQNILFNVNYCSECVEGKYCKQCDKNGCSNQRAENGILGTAVKCDEFNQLTRETSCDTSCNAERTDCGVCINGEMMCQDGKYSLCVEGEYGEEYACKSNVCLGGKCAECVSEMKRCVSAHKIQLCTNFEWGKERFDCGEKMCVDGECQDTCGEAGSVYCIDINGTGFYEVCDGHEWSDFKLCENNHSCRKNAKECGECRNDEEQEKDGYVFKCVNGEWHTTTKPDCQNGSMKCEYDKSYQCQNWNWVAIQECANGCDGDICKVLTENDQCEVNQQVCRCDDNGQNCKKYACTDEVLSFVDNCPNGCDSNGRDCKSFSTNCDGGNYPKCVGNQLIMCIDGNEITSNCDFGCDENKCKERSDVENKCDVGRTKCENNEVFICDNNGNWITKTECSEYQACVMENDTASCTNKCNHILKDISSKTGRKLICDGNGNNCQEYRGISSSTDLCLAENSCYNYGDTGYIVQNCEALSDQYACITDKKCGDDGICNQEICIECTEGDTKCDAGGKNLISCTNGKWDSETACTFGCKENTKNEAYCDFDPKCDYSLICDGNQLKRCDNHVCYNELDKSKICTDSQLNKPILDTIQGNCFASGFVFGEMYDNGQRDAVCINSDETKVGCIPDNENRCLDNIPQSYFNEEWNTLSSGTCNEKCSVNTSGIAYCTFDSECDYVLLNINDYVFLCHNDNTECIFMANISWVSSDYMVNNNLAISSLYDQKDLNGIVTAKLNNAQYEYLCIKSVTDGGKCVGDYEICMDGYEYACNDKNVLEPHECFLQCQNENGRGRCIECSQSNSSCINNKDGVGVYYCEDGYKTGGLLCENASCLSDGSGCGQCLNGDKKFDVSVYGTDMYDISLCENGEFVTKHTCTPKETVCLDNNSASSSDTDQPLGYLYQCELYYNDPIWKKTDCAAGCNTDKTSCLEVSE